MILLSNFVLLIMFSSGIVELNGTTALLIFPNFCKSNTSGIFLSVSYDHIEEHPYEKNNEFRIGLACLSSIRDRS